jgi:hypothetical protein
MKYSCIPCNYETVNKTHYERHVKRPKHIDLCSVTQDCKYCNEQYVKSSGPNNHTVTCDKRSLYELTIETALKTSEKNCIDLEQKYKKLENEFSTLQTKHIDECKNLESKITALQAKHTKECKILESKFSNLQTKYIEEMKQTLDEAKQSKNKTETKYNQLVENSGTIINNSLKTVNKIGNALTYINQNFKNAPILQQMPDFSAFTREKEGQFVEEMIHYDRKKKLAQFIGDIYCDEYVKDNPEQQAMWNKDNIRLTYYVRVSIKGKKTQSHEWITDKKGHHVIECTIRPILNYLDKEIKKYMKKNKTNKNMNGKLLLNLKTCAEMTVQIDNKTLEYEILKYIAPKFDIDKVHKIELLPPQKSL